MHVNFDTDSAHSSNRFSKLGRWYILALSVIAVVAIIGQALIQIHLWDQSSDSRVVNVAGKQRMLSQKISKTVLRLGEGQDTQQRSLILNDLRSSVQLWKVSQEGLLHGNDSLKLPGKNSQEVNKLFIATAPDFGEMLEASQKIISVLSKDLLASRELMEPEIQRVLTHERKFLSGMESIVAQYDNEAKEKVSSLSTMEYILLVISLLVIVLEVFFIFRPTARQVNTTVNRLIDSEKNAMKLSKEIGALYSSLEKSYVQISIVNQPAENPRLYAKSDHGGNVIFISELFSELSGIGNVSDDMRLCNLFPGMDNPDDWMDEVVANVSEGNSWQGEIHFIGLLEDCWAEVTITPLFDNQNEVDELIVMGTDITSRKAAEQTMTRKNRAEIEKKINQQKFRSVLILEGQEEERKRIAMDIHDGIGQMLTSLKFQIESINLDNNEAASQKITEIDQQIKYVIKEVRRITFNLKPTVLGDFGLQAALNVFVQEIGKLTDIQLIYRSEGQIERLPQKIENNIFRIIQEAINNAIKYSGASAIEVSMSELDGDLVITVNDEGKGFDLKLVEARSTNIESGRGFFNMYERTEYVNGRLEIHSEPGKGTTVMLTVPVRVGVLEH